MADLEFSLRTLFLNDAAIVAIIGQQFVWNVIPEGMDAPLIRARTISDVPHHTQSNSDSGRALVQLDILHSSKVSCNALATLVKDTFDGYSGAIGEFKARILIKDAPSDWFQDIRLFNRTIEMDVGYVK